MSHFHSFRSSSLVQADKYEKIKGDSDESGPVDGRPKVDGLSKSERS